MVVGDAHDFSLWLATPNIFHGGWQRPGFFMVVGNPDDFFSWWLATPMIFDSGWQRLCFFMVVGNAYDFMVSGA